MGAQDQASAGHWSSDDERLLRFAKLEAELAEEGLAGPDYVFLVITSCLIATFGLLANSTAVIIGAMLVAPLMLPIRAMAFGVLRGDVHRVEFAGVALAIGVALAVGLSSLVGWVVGLPEFGSEVLARTSPNLLDLGVAIVAGAVSAQAKLKPNISDTLAGTAIAVALMPPLCTVGLCLALGESHLAWGAFLLFVTNLLGIALACMVVFTWGGLGLGRARTRQALGWTVGLTALVVVPLALSFVKLLDQARTAALAKRLLVTSTHTFGNRMVLLDSRVDWGKTPPELALTVRTPEAPSPKQVRLLEQFLLERTKQPFELVFEVSRLELIRGRAPEGDEGDEGHPGHPDGAPTEAPQAAPAPSPLPEGEATASPALGVQPEAAGSGP